MTCAYLSLILNCSLIVFGGELGMHPALFEATVARLEIHDLAKPRLIIAQLGIMVGGTSRSVAAGAAGCGSRPAVTGFAGVNKTLNI